MPGIKKEINPEDKKTFYATLLFLGSEARFIFFTCLIAAYVFYAGASPTDRMRMACSIPGKLGFTQCVC